MKINVKLDFDVLKCHFECIHSEKVKKTGKLIILYLIFKMNNLELKCNFCTHLSVSITNYHQHLLEYHKSQKTIVFDCKFCRLKFFSAKKFKTHLSDHNVNLLEFFEELFKH